jgi:hypothetical protein
MKYFIHSLVLFFLAAIFISCESLPLNYYSGSSWSQHNALKRTIRLEKVFVDRVGGGYSIESEIIGLAPLIFAERGYRHVTKAETADYVETIDYIETTDYVVDVRAREREFAVGWNTRRSLAMEVRIWPYRDGTVTGYLPLAAGRIISLGDRSFSSSEITSRMLTLAIRRAVKALESVEKKDAKTEKSNKAKQEKSKKVPASPSGRSSAK